MANRRRKFSLFGLLAAAVGCLCAVLLGVVFYGAMAYQLAGEDVGAPESVSGVLALSGAQTQSERAYAAQFGDTSVHVTERRYALSGGQSAQAITADSAAYLQRIAQEGWQVQPVTGFVLAGAEAVYAVRGQEGMLAAAGDDTAYVLIAPAQEQTLYELGASAVLN